MRPHVLLLLVVFLAYQFGLVGVALYASDALLAAAIVRFFPPRRSAVGYRARGG